MSATDKRRVVVTGLGIVSGIGFGEEESWSHLLAGESGMRPLTAYDASAHRAPFGSEIDRERLAEAVRALGARPQDRTLDMALVAADQALRQAGLIEGEAPHAPQEIATIFGSGGGSLDSIQTTFERFVERGVRGARPTTVTRVMGNAVSAGLSLHFKLTGTNQLVVTACTSAANAIGQAMRMVRHGYAERVLCGGSEGLFFPYWYGIWNNLGVLAKGDDPKRACRPFDAERSGCVMGEGAAALVIESEPAARARGARIRGELMGYGESSDATHITRPSVEGQSSAIRRALADAGIAPAEVGYINAHGTATPANDLTESHSIREAFGDDADRIPVGANKSYFGHTLGASGALESVVTLLSLEHGRVPPNLNLERLDPECPILPVGDAPQSIEQPIAVKNSFGFGGGNGVLVLGRSDR